MFGEAFLIGLAVFPFMYIVSWGFEQVLMRRKYGKLINITLNILFFFGVIVHESCHRVMCAISGVPVEKMSVSYRHQKLGTVAPRGYVRPSRKFQITFMQGFLIAFAPLLIGIWIFYFLLVATFNQAIDPILRIITGILSVSVLLCSQPSMGDLGMVWFHYRNDPRHGTYQLFLLFLSFMITWSTVGLFNIFLPFEFLYYFIMIFYYFAFKYAFILTRILIHKIWDRRGKSRYKPHYKRYVRRRTRPDMVNRFIEGD